MGSDAQPYAVGFKPAALRDLRKLPRDQQKSIGGRIGALERNPRPPGCEPIKGAKGLLRIHAGAYRIVYQPDDTARTVLIICIGHRKDIYDELMRRLKG